MKKHHLLFALCFGILAFALTSCGGTSYYATVASPWGSLDYDSEEQRVQAAVDAGAIAREILDEK